MTLFFIFITPSGPLRCDILSLKMLTKLKDFEKCHELERKCLRSNIALNSNTLSKALNKISKKVKWHFVKSSPEMLRIIWIAPYKDLIFFFTRSLSMPNWRKSGATEAVFIKKRVENSLYPKKSTSKVWNHFFRRKTESSPSKLRTRIRRNLRKVRRKFRSIDPKVIPNKHE